jgi:arylsulfatase A-like enzyme
LNISGDSWAAKPTSFIRLLYENTTAIETPETNADGSKFHLSHGMADQAIKWLDRWKGLRDVPFFMYYTPGAVHAPDSGA